MSMKKKALMAASYVMVAAMAIGGTVAYLTDRDNATNTFTMGDVEIELNEKFDQGSELLPGVNIEKVPTITNTGKSDAYVWMTFSIPSALDNWNLGTEEGSNNNVIHWNPTGSTLEGKDGSGNLYVTQTRVDKAIKDGILPEGTTAEQINKDNTTWNVFNSLGEGVNAYQEEINGVNYNTYVLLYNAALESGEETLPSIYNVFLDANVDVTPDGDMYKVVKGEATDLNWNINKNGAPKIYVNAYGIQAEGFETVDEAYAAYVNQWNAEGETGLNGIYEDVTVANAESAAELNTALANGNNAVMTADVTTDTNVVLAGGTLNGDGNTLTKTGTVLNQDGQPLNAGVLTTGGTVQNLVVVDNTNVGQTSGVRGLRAIYVNGMTEDMNIENCTLTGTYAINVNAANKPYTLNVSNSTLNGWTSYGTIGGATFTDCTFGEGSTGLNHLRAYCDTVLTNCELSGTTIDTIDDTTHVVVGSVKLVNCTYNGEPITEDMLTGICSNGYGDEIDAAILASVTVE